MVIRSWHCRAHSLDEVGSAKGGQLDQGRSARPEEVGSAIFEYQIPSIGMWSDSRLKELSIESKNT